MLTLAGISKNFGGLQVLDDVSLNIPARGIFGLIGPNGAGKTTVFNLVTGMLTPTSGTIDFAGRRLNGMAPYQITRQGVARTFQNIRIFREMTLIENVLVALGERPSYSASNVLLPLPSHRHAVALEYDNARELLARVGLVEKAERLARMLSYGEQRRLEIARALATRPKLLLLDEPAAGMNSAEKLLLMDEIFKLEDSGLSLLIIEHDMRFIMGLCRQVAVLNFGRLIAQGTPDDIRSNGAVIEAYLGTDDEVQEQRGRRS
jgi:branched-chain amino acid transport system ATP-binding protein